MAARARTRRGILEALRGAQHVTAGGYTPAGLRIESLSRSAQKLQGYEALRGRQAKKKMTLTTTDLFLFILILAACILIYQAKQIINLLDALGDITGDFLRAILDELRKDTK
jgi:hypothetical protein